MRKLIGSAQTVTCVAHERFPEHVGRTYPILKRQRNALKLRAPDGKPVWIRLEHICVKDEHSFITLDAVDGGGPLGSYAVDLFGAYDDNGRHIANYFLPDLPQLGAVVTGRTVEYVADPYIPSAESDS